ncbi:MAG: type II secretion system secretin GspD [Alphaproteobacteria bacterium]|nr:type II secretion system secretin GspD [Alphaproteobacteria bacterium]
MAWLAAVLASTLSACSSLPPAREPGDLLDDILPPSGTQASAPAKQGSRPLVAQRAPADEVRFGPIALGERGGAAAEIAAGRPTSGEALRVDFDQTPLADVARVILGDLLHLNYAIYPGVAGEATIHAEVRPDALLSTLERLLDINGAALRWAGGSYHVLPMEEANRLGFRNIEGDRVAVLQLDFLDAQAAADLVTPLLRAATLVRVDKAHNFIVLTGSATEISSIRETLKSFDVNWLANQSFALVTLEHATPEALVKDLKQLLAGSDEEAAAMAGGIKLFALDRLNAVLAVAASPDAIKSARTWIHRLDSSTLASAMRLHVYQVESTRADRLLETLAAALGQALSGESSQPQSEETGQVRDVTMSAGPQDKAADDAAGESYKPVTSSLATGKGGEARALTIGAMRVVADPAREAIVVFGTPSDYATLEPLLRQLDVPPRQVLIEATVAEVTLTDELRYGVEWFFRKHFGDLDASSDLSFPTSSSLGGGLPASGLTLTLGNGVGSIEAALQLLDQDSDVRVLATPHIFVTERETAQIQVGDQVPILTQTIDVVGDSSDDRSVNSVEYRDTGVILRVTPRIGRDGLVSLSLTQEVSQVKPNTVTSLESPTFSRRLLESTVAVPNGRTLFIGGLIQTSSRDLESGIPLLKDLPVVGSIFSNTTKGRDRTELIILLRPVVLDTPQNADLINDEIRQKIKLLKSDMAAG